MINDVIDMATKEIVHIRNPISMMFFLPYFCEICGTTGEKKNDENSDATIIIDTTGALISTGPYPDKLKVFST